MTEKKNILWIFEKEMIPKIYGFCRVKLNTIEDAEDLSQDICLEVLQAINANKQIENLNKAFAQGFFHQWSGVDSSVFFDTPDEVFALCRDIIKGIVSIDQLNEKQKYLFSIALEKKLFVKTDTGFKQNYYYIDYAERIELEKIAREFYNEVSPLIERAYKIVLNEYAETVPKHLHWQMGNFLSNNLNCFVTCSLNDARNNGKLSDPDENNKEWLSLFASE